MARPKKDNARTIMYKVRLNETENRMLTEASEYAASPKSEVFRSALQDYYRGIKKNPSKQALSNAASDMSVACGNGIINIRVGAIILKDTRFLMVRNYLSDYFYSVGGLIKFGETAEEAVVREVFEETGVRMEIDHLGFIQDNYYYLCEASDTIESQNLDDYEAEERFTLKYIDPKTAIETNRRDDYGPKDPVMLEREARVLEMLFLKAGFTEEYRTDEIIMLKKDLK